MPHYFFHLYNDIVALDDEGLTLPDLETARRTAISNIRDLMVDDLLRGRVALQHRIDIADETGTILTTVPFRDAVTVEG